MCNYISLHLTDCRLLYSTARKLAPTCRWACSLVFVTVMLSLSRQALPNSLPLAGTPRPNNVPALPDCE